MDKTNILQQLFEKDYAVKTIAVLPGKLDIKFKNISFEDQAQLENTLKLLSKDELNTRQFLQAFSIHLLTYTLLSWGDKSFDSPEQWLGFLSKKSLSVINKAVEEQQKFEKEIKQAIELDTINETFFPGAKKADDSEPSLRESTSAKEEPSEKS